MRGQSTPYVHLTPRQLDVLGLAAEGMTYGQMARKLGIGRQTIKMHLTMSMQTLGAANTTNAVARWLCMEDAPVAVAPPVNQPSHRWGMNRPTGTGSPWRKDDMIIQRVG